jgi:Zn-finger nucleic acid-binding protein
MRCPRCEDAELLERDRQGITVDLCVSCRGVWLDRGELEKLMAKAEAAAAEDEAYYARREPRERDSTPPRGVPIDPRAVQRPPPEYRGQEPRHAYGQDPRHGYGHDGKHGYGHGHPRKRKTWLDSLGDIFD